MSNNESHGSQNFFFVDGKKIETDQTAVTGSQIKVLAQVDPAYQLFLEEKGNDPDRAVSDADNFDVSKKPPLHFYAVPPATFGGQ